MAEPAALECYRLHIIQPVTTAKDIALKLNISPSTVGRALSDDPRISAATRQRVMEAAVELGYVVNRAARMMRGVPSNLVGLVVPDIRNSFYYTIAHALSKCLEAEGYQLMLSETDDDRNAELRHLRELASANVAGIIIVASARPLPESARLLAATPHIQLLRRHQALGDQWFGIDDTAALEMATRHLVGLGHRNIAYIGGSPDLPTGMARLQGFRNALKGVGGARAHEEVGTPSSTQVGSDALARLLALPDPPTAMVLGSVPTTHGVLQACNDRGIRVPQDLSVVGFGDEPGFRWWGPGLTTLSLPVSELATASGLWFLQQLKSRAVAMTPHSAVSPVQLLVRGSTGPAPVALAAAPSRARPRQHAPQA